MLLSIKKDVHLALARGEATAVVLLDQPAAFDHGTPLDCLTSWFGIGDVVLDLFRSYLSDHSQCVKIASILFDAKKSSSGVPQGSVLCPIFFPLYTYSPQQSHSKSSWHKFPLLCNNIHGYMFI